jgi:hypothetical protein
MLAVTGHADWQVRYQQGEALGKVECCVRKVTGRAAAAPHGVGHCRSQARDWCLGQQM